MRIALLVLFLMLAAPAFAAESISNINPAAPSAATPAAPPAEAPPAPIVEPEAPPQEFTAEDRADIERIQLYLNELKSISADFLQVDERGGIMRGTIAIQRPGKMRVTYTSPKGDFIVADGDFVHIWNADLQSQTNVPQNNSLANFILRDPIVLSGDVTVTSLKRFPAKLEMTLAQTGDSGTGKLTLIFEDHPLLLRQWKVIDPQGRIVGVNLENEQSDVRFPDSTFTFVPPSFGHGVHTPQTVP
jgi:outer membrane lipoprotein-sorting protein